MRPFHGRIHCRKNVVPRNHQAPAHNSSIAEGGTDQATNVFSNRLRMSAANSGKNPHSSMAKAAELPVPTAFGPLTTTGCQRWSGKPNANSG
jgi:hypothetical protein